MATVHNELPLRLQLLKGPRNTNSLFGASMSIPPELDSCGRYRSPDPGSNRPGRLPDR